MLPELVPLLTVIVDETVPENWAATGVAAPAGPIGNSASPADMARTAAGIRFAFTDRSSCRGLVSASASGREGPVSLG
jgi:hypothetical protein